MYKCATQVKLNSSTAPLAHTKNKIFIQKKAADAACKFYSDFGGGGGGIATAPVSGTSSSSMLLIP